MEDYLEAGANVQVGASEPSRIGKLPGADRTHDIPVPLSSFIGRRHEIDEVRSSIRKARLLSLTGPGGSGKTRLALEAARGLLDEHPGGVWWVELAALGDGRLVPAAIAQSLGVRPLPGLTELQACCAFLAPRETLIVLDNCEHVRESVAESVEELLVAAPRTKILATSRASLGVNGETEWRIPPLSLPDVEGRDRGVALRSDAVNLFVERARQAGAGFALDDSKAPAVVALCKDLDGLPLAIELAAARTRMLTVPQIATALSDRFRVLTGGPQTVSSRQRTLRASVDWSHELLTPEEQVLFRRMSVFAGGCTLQAVGEVCAYNEIEQSALLDLLGGLIDQSLVLAAEHRGEARYRLLETMRHYAADRLTDAGEFDSVSDRHRDSCLALAEAAAPRLQSREHRAWLERLDSESANLDVAIDRAIATHPGLALRFCAALGRWWWVRGRFAEAERAHGRAIDAGRAEAAELRAQALISRAFLAVTAGHTDKAEQHATEALDLAGELQDVALEASAHLYLGFGRMFADPAGGRVELRRGAELAKEADEPWVRTFGITEIAFTYLYQHDHVAGAVANEEGRTLAEPIGDPLHESRYWFYRGWMAIADARFAEGLAATQRMREAIAGIGDPTAEAVAAVGDAHVDIWTGDSAASLERLETHLKTAIERGAGVVVPVLLASIAWAEIASGRFSEASKRLDGLLPIVDGRDAYATAWTRWLRADSLRLLDDPNADAAAEEAMSCAEGFGNRLFATRARLISSRLAAGRGDGAVASEHAQAHLDSCVEGGHLSYLPAALDALAEARASCRDHLDAARLLGQADRARSETGVVRIPPESGHWAAIESEVRGALGEDQFGAARAEGEAMTVDEAAAWIRRSRGPRNRPLGGWDSLTPTELNVAALVAEGLTNPQIGERMFVTRATVKTHLTHIFRKLDIDNRAELAAEVAKRHI